MFGNLVIDKSMYNCETCISFFILSEKISTDMLLKDLIVQIYQRRDYMKVGRVDKDH